MQVPLENAAAPGENFTMFLGLQKHILYLSVGHFGFLLWPYSPTVT
jgi:hypothetical protein